MVLLFFEISAAVTDKSFDAPRTPLQMAIR